MLFTDLVGSTALMTRLGDVAFDELRGEHFRRLREAISAGGEEVKNTGDGLLVTFASVVDALAAAVAVQQATNGHAQSAGTELAIRVGLALGEVGFEDGDVFGTPVVEAARLVAVAQPGQILATAVVRMVAGSRAGVPFCDVGPLQLKGLPEPVAVCEVQWAPPPAPVVPLPALFAGVGRIFVGREPEAARLHRLWEEAAGGGRRMALLAGEPGIGKTRLATELARAVHADGALVLAGRCDEGMGVPYQPFVEALRHYVVQAEAPRLGRYGGELAPLVPELSEIVPGLAEPLRSDPETERYRLFDALAGWLAEVSAETPVLLVLDDLHWAAKPTLLLVRHVIRFAEPLRLLVVGTYRDSEVGRSHPLSELLADLRRSGGFERLPLSGLDQAAVVAFLEAAAGHALAPGDEAFSSAVWAETEGNPFFVAEVLRHLTETGGVEYRGDRWVVTAPVEALGIPEGVRDVVGQRLSRLSEDANRALRVASVVGLEFDGTVVRAAGDFGEDLLLAVLDEAVAASLLAEVPNGAVHYRFSHALVRATLYDELSAARRVSLHRRVAEAVEAVHAGDLDSQLPALAHHWARASAPAAETTRAVHYATRAGDRALALLAPDEAAVYYSQALELLELAEGVSHDLRRLDLLIALGEAQRRAGDPAFRETLLTAFAAAREGGDAERMAKAALANSRGTFSTTGIVDAERVAALRSSLDALGPGHPALQARLLALLGVELLWSDDREAPRALSDEALALARSQGDSGVLASVMAMRWSTLWHPRWAGERFDLAAALLSIAETTGDPYVRFWGLWRRGLAAMELADPEEAALYFEAADSQAGELGHAFPRWCALLSRVPVAVASGRLAEAEAEADRAAAFGRETGQPDGEILHVANLAGIRFEQGRLGEMESKLQEEVDRRPAVPLFRALLAQAYCDLGRFDEARSTFAPLAGSGLGNQVFDYFAAPTAAVLAVVCTELGDLQGAAALSEVITPYADQVASHPLMWLGAFSHHLGRLATVLGRFSEADDRFRAAAATHERLAAPTWLARTRLEWARMLVTRGEPGDGARAVDLARQALVAARDLGLAGLERQAAAMLA